MQKNRPTWIAFLAKVFALHEAWILQKCNHCGRMARLSLEGHLRNVNITDIIRR